MIRRRRPSSRSRAVLCAMAAVGAVLCWAFGPWSPQSRHDTPSLLWIHRALPWPVLSALFAAYVLLLLLDDVRTVVAGCYLGLGMYSCQLVGLLITAHTHTVTTVLIVGGRHFTNSSTSGGINWLVLGAVFLACVLHWAEGRLALNDARHQPVGT